MSVERRGEPKRREPGPSAFTLVEMLVVIAIVAILSALVTPALQGLMGTSGRRGGVNALTSALDQARLAAIENGTTVHVGFPTNAQNSTNAFSHFIVFRDARPGLANDTAAALSRWQRLPNGVFFAAGPGLNTNVLVMRQLSSGTLPRLGGEAEQLRRIPSLAFNRFGQMLGITNEAVILVGEKIGPTNSWRGRTNNYYEVRIQPLTGRSIVRDMSTNSPSP